MMDPEYRYYNSPVLQVTYCLPRKQLCFRTFGKEKKVRTVNNTYPLRIVVRYPTCWRRSKILDAGRCEARQHTKLSCRAESRAGMLVVGLERSSYDTTNVIPVRLSLSFQ
jgi:hypothetical protein